MSEQQAAYMVEALADGKHMTESGVNGMIYVEPITEAEEFAKTLASITYIETLEQALKGLRDAYELEVGSEQCSLCGEWVNDEGHAPDCIVPALIAKYPDA